MDYSKSWFSSKRPSNQEILERAWNQARPRKSQGLGFFPENAYLDFWWQRVEAGLVQLINYEELVRFFGSAKTTINEEHGTVSAVQRPFSDAWKSVIASLFYGVYGWASATAPQFYASIRPPTIADMDTMPATGYPIFSSETNRQLLQLTAEVKEQHVKMFGLDIHPRGLEAEWVEFVESRYTEWLKTFAKINTVVDPSGKDRRRFTLDRPLGIGPDQRVFMVIDDAGTRAVVKWDGDTSQAIGNWESVTKAGVPMIEWSGAFEITPSQSLLFFELMTPLGPTDNPFAVMRDVLRQLETLHRAGFCHSDIKPDNIMRRADGSYSLIDFDGISRNPSKGVPNALFRSTFSVIWTSQLPASKLTSYRYDLEELYYGIGDHIKDVNFALSEGRGMRPVRLQIAAEGLTVEQAQEYVRTRPRTAVEWTTLEDRILALPERMPFSEIEYGWLISLAERLVEHGKRMAQNVRETVSQCMHCGVEIQHQAWPVHRRKKKIGHACGLRCAVHSDPRNYLKQAAQHIKFREANEKREPTPD
jgi:hypothetical protein